MNRNHWKLVGLHAFLCFWCVRGCGISKNLRKAKSLQQNQSTSYKNLLTKTTLSDKRGANSYKAYKNTLFFEPIHLWNQWFCNRIMDAPGRPNGFPRAPQGRPGTSDVPRTPPGTSLGRPWAPHDAPGTSQGRPRTSQGCPREVPGTSSDVLGHPRGRPKGRPKESLGRPWGVPGASLGRPWYLFKKIAAALAIKPYLR